MCLLFAYDVCYGTRNVCQLSGIATLCLLSAPSVLTTHALLQPLATHHRSLIALAYIHSHRHPKRLCLIQAVLAPPFSASPLHQLSSTASPPAPTTTKLSCLTLRSRWSVATMDLAPHLCATISNNGCVRRLRYSGQRVTHASDTTSDGCGKTAAEKKQDKIKMCTTGGLCEKCRQNQ